MPLRWSGRIVDEAARPHAGMVVTLEPIEPPRVRLGQATTTDDGRFEIVLDAAPAWDTSEGVALGVFDVLGLRPLLRWPLPELVAGGDVGERVVPGALASGWLATGEDGALVRHSVGNAVDVLVDDEAFVRAEDLVRDAKRSIRLAQLLMEVDFSASRATFARPAFLDLLVDAGARGVDVRLLLNHNAVMPDSVDSITDAVDARGARNVRVRAFPLSPNVLHVKYLVVDDREAMIIGPPFQQKYWDTTSHLREEPRRGGQYPPVHDVSLHLRGPVVRDIGAAFAELWSLRARPTPGELADADDARAGEVATPPPPSPEGKQTAQFVRTMPPGLLPQRPAGETTILESYLRAIAQARDYLYLENQYYTNPSVSEALVRALRRRPKLQVVLVLNEETDVPTYIAWQKRRLAEMGYPRQDRLGVFVLRSTVPIYVHSKVAIADDAWATIGTANLDSMSLETADEFGAPLAPNVDANVVLLDGIDGAPFTGAVGRIRRMLWAEHLGDEGVWTATPPDGGWLSLWRGVAARNLDRHRRGQPLVGRVLPYQPRELAPERAQD